MRKIGNEAIKCSEVKVSVTKESLFLARLVFFMALEGPSFTGILLASRG